MITTKSKFFLVFMSIISLLNFTFADRVVISPTERIIFFSITFLIVGAVIAGIVAIVIYVLRRIKKKSVIKIKK
jgi:hypothetical protein